MNSKQVRKYRVEITKKAEADLWEIRQYIADDSDAAAEKFVNEIEHQIDSLEQFSLRCPVIPESKDLNKEYRHIIHGNYRTIFRVESDRVIIMRVIHGARLLNLEVFEK